MESGAYSGGISVGWRSDQIKYFHRYVEPIIGNIKLQKVASIHVARVLRLMNELKLSEQMQLHVYNLMHKMFEDAIELFELINRNPVIKRFRPTVRVKESKYLSIEDAKRLLIAVSGTPIEAAVRIQLYCGLRIGEVQALKWENVDFKQGLFGRLLVAGTYVRKEKRFKDSPKGGQQHYVDLPEELGNYLLELSERSNSQYVASFHSTDFMAYAPYFHLLKKVCKEANIPWVGTHGLRHSTSQIYLAHGASYDDLRNLFAHSSSSVTDRYIHDTGTQLKKVANVIRLFPNCSQIENDEVESKNKKVKRSL